MRITDKFNFYDALIQGFRNKASHDREQESKKVGFWRGGSSGCITSKGVVLGSDPRVTVLRFLGIQMVEHTLDDYDTKLMQDAGYKSEESIEELLKFASVEYQSDADIPMEYTLSNGDSVKGRPDLVLLDNGTPTLGVEHKLICSPNGAAEKAAWFKGKPDTTHFVQACHYASHFGIPWVLAYTNRVWQSFPYYAAKDKAAEQKHMLHPEHRAIFRTSAGKPFLIKPFQSFYDITLDSDGETFLLDGEKTMVTKKGIQDYYLYCAECIANKEIPSKRGGSMSFMGEEIEKNKNLLYDPFKEANSLGTFDEWVESCREISKKGLDI